MVDGTADSERSSVAERLRHKAEYTSSLKMSGDAVERGDAADVVRELARTADQRPATVTVWACPQCGFWRQRQETGIHVCYDDDGPGKRHELVPTTYERSSDNLREVLADDLAKREPHSGTGPVRVDVTPICEHWACRE